MTADALAGLLWALFTDAELATAVAESGDDMETFADHSLFERPAGIRRSLKALARAKKKNIERVKKGQKPVVGGKAVTLRTFADKLGVKPKTVKRRAMNSQQASSGANNA